MIALLISLALLVSIPLVASAEIDVSQHPRGQILTNQKHLPPNCDQSSDDKECKDFQIIVNKSHSELNKFTKEVLPEILKKIKLKSMGLTSV